MLCPGKGRKIHEHTCETYPKELARLITPYIAPYIGNPRKYFRK